MSCTCRMNMFRTYSVFAICHMNLDFHLIYALISSNLSRTSLALPEGPALSDGPSCASRTRPWDPVTQAPPGPLSPSVIGAGQCPKQLLDHFAIVPLWLNRQSQGSSMTLGMIQIYHDICNQTNALFCFRWCRFAAAGARRGRGSRLGA